MTHFSETLSISKLDRSAGQHIPRHFCRACSTGEGKKVIRSWHSGYYRVFDWTKINTDDPVYVVDHIEFYAQWEG